MSDPSCSTCEYFDRGIADKDGYSDCLNRRSRRFQTYATWTCIEWTEDSMLENQEE